MSMAHKAALLACHVVAFLSRPTSALRSLEMNTTASDHINETRTEPALPALLRARTHPAKLLRRSSPCSGPVGGWTKTHTADYNQTWKMRSKMRRQRLKKTWAARR